jgi:hypothetical protein
VVESHALRVAEFGCRTLPSDPIKQFDVVALTEDIPAQGLKRGQVGTVVEELGPDGFEVEFADNEGHTYASLGLKANQLIVLHYEPAAA